MTALQQREQTFKETPHKARQTALCGVFLALTTFGEAYQKWYCLNCLHNLSVLDSVTKNFSVSVCRYVQDLWRSVEKTTQFRRF
nr:MAG TPA: hypothetical protein [Caudoviricetes sp.]